jgi:hypothetical protein
MKNIIIYDSFLLILLFDVGGLIVITLILVSYLHAEPPLGLVTGFDDLSLHQPASEHNGLEVITTPEFLKPNDAVLHYPVDEDAYRR